ncbi:Putative cation exchanger C521.04c [Serendipita indica DSM 11827]|nr:Putative cation exchanger C521.04c [Serendipita indica DSM 11827]
MSTADDGGRRSPGVSTSPVGIRRTTSQWTDAPSQSYFPPTSPSRRPGNSRFPSNATGGNTASNITVKGRKRREVRSASLTSSHHGGYAAPPGSRPRTTGAFSEEDETETIDAVDSADDNDERADAFSGDEHDEETQTPKLGEQEEVTLKERQSLINDEHPFGLPIWKPALYRKSRTVTREAETALHGVPSASRDLLIPGNILWTLLFGWWISLSFIITSLIMYIIPFGARTYAPVVYGLGWYLFWPFGRYVEGDLPPSEPPTEEEESNGDGEDEDERPTRSRTVSGHSNTGTVRPGDVGGQSTVRAMPTTNQPGQHAQDGSWNPGELSSLLAPQSGQKSYGATPSQTTQYNTLPSHNYGVSSSESEWTLFGKCVYYFFLVFKIAPTLLLVCTICWACVFTIPMAKLQWELLKYLFTRPESIRFCSAPKIPVVTPSTNAPDTIAEETEGQVNGAADSTPVNRPYLLRRATLRAGQIAPSGSPNSSVLLCIYRAMGFRYYKYTVGGVNIMFINLMPVVFFVILDGLVLLPWVEKKHHHGEHVDPFLRFIGSQGMVFVLSLASVIPLSYFIGMAVASISAQSSIGMGAVINATFGSIIEIILYAIALTQGKGRLVEGSIVGSILAGVLLMPGASMCSMALRRKEQDFNAKSASVTSTMLIMAIFGTLTPTLFYSIYGNFQLVCEGCPDGTVGHPTIPTNSSTLDVLSGGIAVDPPWICKHCYYAHPNPVTDPFYQETVKPLMYFCAIILVLSYLIGLWFSLRTHASQIWQNPRQLMEPHPLDLNAPGGTGRMSLYHRLLHMPSGLPSYRHSESQNRRSGSQARPESVPRRPMSLRRKASAATTATTTGDSIYGGSLISRGDSTVRLHDPQQPPSHITLPPSPTANRRIGPALPTGAGYTPIIETVSQATKAAVDPMVLPPPTLTVSGTSGEPTRLNLTTDEFTRAVAVATVSALRADAVVGARMRAAGGGEYPHGHSQVSGGGHGGGHGGHDAPSWSRAVSASVLLACTLLYAIIAEILVDVVDVVLQGSGIDEKLLGITLFALVPNTTEFMNAMSFAINGNISLSMEIGSAYALQVCLLQIPAMVAFSAWYDPRHMGTGADTFTLIFPRWDVIAIILSIFLLTYTYIEAKSNYHRGSILILSYLVMTSGFYFAPHDKEEDESIVNMTQIAQAFPIQPLMHVVKTYFFSLFSR